MNELFLINADGTLRQLERVSCRNEEKEIQDLLQNNYHLLPSRQIDPDDPPEWLMIVPKCSSCRTLSPNP